MDLNFLPKSLLTVRKWIGVAIRTLNSKALKSAISKNEYSIFFGRKKNMMIIKKFKTNQHLVRVVVNIYCVDQYLFALYVIHYFLCKKKVKHFMSYELSFCSILVSINGFRINPNVTKCKAHIVFHWNDSISFFSLSFFFSLFIVDSFMLVPMYGAVFFSSSAQCACISM